jgi:hypothetical protein
MYPIRSLFSKDLSGNKSRSAGFPNPSAEEYRFTPEILLDKNEAGWEETPSFFKE